MKWFLSISIIALFACSNSKKIDQASSEGNGQELFSKEEVTLTFERSVCFGSCPAFKVIIMNDGNCFYEGYKFVDLEGNYKAKIDQNQMNSILAEAKRIGFYEMKDVYDNHSVTDVPSVNIELAGPNGIKKVYSRYDAPEELNDFGKFIDSIVLKLDWKESKSDSQSND